MQKCQCRGRLQNKILAEVCDGLAKYTKKSAKDTSRTSEVKDLLKHTENFKSLAKIFRALNYNLK